MYLCEALFIIAMGGEDGQYWQVPFVAYVRGTVVCGTTTSTTTMDRQCDPTTTTMKDVIPLPPPRMDVIPLPPQGRM